MEIFVVIALAGFVWWWVSRSAPGAGSSEQPKAMPTATDANKAAPINRQSAHIASALAHAQREHGRLSAQQQEHQRWQQRFGETSLRQIDALDGVAFEGYLAGLLRERGYVVEITPAAGDFGADLILSRNGERTAVQAKRWRDRVGVAGVQEAIAGRDYYRCDSGWVITTSGFTAQAHELAAKARITLVDRTALARWIAERETMR